MSLFFHVARGGAKEAQDATENTSLVAVPDAAVPLGHRQHVSASAPYKPTTHPWAAVRQLAAVVVSPTCAASSWSSNRGLLSSGTKPPAAATGGGCCGESMAKHSRLARRASLLRRGPVSTCRHQSARLLVTAWRSDGTREESHRDLQANVALAACLTRGVACQVVCVQYQSVCVCLCESLSRGASQGAPSSSIQQQERGGQVSTGHQRRSGPSLAFSAVRRRLPAGAGTSCMGAPFPSRGADPPSSWPQSCIPVCVVIPQPHGGAATTPACLRVRPARLAVLLLVPPAVAVGRGAPSEGGNDAVLDPAVLVLGHALGHPHQVADLLFPELEVGPVDAVVELQLKHQHAPLHFLLIERPV